MHSIKLLPVLLTLLISFALPNNRSIEAVQEDLHFEGKSFAVYDQALAATLRKLISNELKNCMISIVYEQFFENSTTLEVLAKLNMLKQARYKLLNCNYLTQNAQKFIYEYVESVLNNLHFNIYKFI